VDYAELSHSELKRRIATSPVDTSDFQKAIAELNRRHQARMSRIVYYGALIAALGILVRMMIST
jgi:hypothetical protein